MVDKNLLPYNLAIVAIFKDESPYLREWLDYHLLAGVEHFYLYNNDSSDNCAEVLKPYVDTGLVTLIDWPGKMMQTPAYDDALERSRFFCRYVAFIDLDEFIFPRTGQSIAEVVDEIFSHDAHAATLKINWQVFGSNGHETADLSRGVLERFTRRAPTDWVFDDEKLNRLANCNAYVKILVNPRRVNSILSPHHAICFEGLHCVNADGRPNEKPINLHVAADKIVLNHYYAKSREEYAKNKMSRGWAYANKNPYSSEIFDLYDRNEVFDDGILTYSAARAKNFSLEGDAQRIQRAEKVLLDTLTAKSPLTAPADFFVGKLETFLTCRKLAEVFATRIGNKSAEEYALVWIYQTLTQATTTSHAEFQLFLKALPEILSRPFPLTKKILRLTCDELIPAFCDALKLKELWEPRTALLDLQKFLNLMR